MDLPKDVERWRLNWIAANNRQFNSGEMLTELIAAVNLAMTALGFSRIRPPNGRFTPEQLLAKIPKEKYADVVEVLCSNGNQSNSNNINNNNKRQHPGAETIPQDGQATNNIVAVGSPCKRKSDDLPVLTLAKVFRTAAESRSGAPEAAEGVSKGNPVRGSSRKNTVTLTFPAAVYHYPDIFAEDSTFSTDTRAQEFVTRVKQFYNHSLTNLKGQSSNSKVQCAILNRDNVGFAAATFVLRDSSPSKPSALVVTLPS